MSKRGSIIRVGLAAMPYAGSILATAYSEWDTNRRFCRIKETISELGRQIQQCGASFDPKTIRDEELQLLEEVLRRVEIEHSEKKRLRFATLTNSAWLATGRLG